MSHHYSGPDFKFPHGDARLDFADLYAFPKPGDASKSILIMNVHPSAGENPPGPTTAEPFASEALYELKIDTDGDAIANIAYRVRFSAFEGGAQTAIVRRIDGRQAGGTGDGGRVIVDGAPVSTGRDAKITEAGDTRFFAGWRSDPFFCDVEGAKNNLQFTGDDFFADKDVGSIVLEVPNSALGAKEVRLWARTLAPNDGGWIQVERGARPAQAVILVEERDAYLAGEPANDERFLAAFAHALEHTGGYTPAEAKRVAGTLLPDVLSYDPTRPACFPNNGRTLTNDAFDSFIRILTSGKVAEDNVGPHADLLLEFPYVGPPHQSRATKDQNYAAMSEHAHVEGVYPFPAVMQTRTIETNGTSIHVRVGGHGPAVVMLHGFGTTGDMWGHLASALIEDHMIVALDLRGLGLSSKPDGGYDKKNQAADVVGVLDALSVRRAELVTHDIGIMVGFAVAATHPERVSRWVAIDAPLPGVGPWDQIKQDPAMWHFGFGGQDMERLVAGRERIYLDRFWNELSRDQKRFDEAKRQHYAALYALPGAMRAGFAQFLAFSQDATDNRTFLAQGKLQMPVLALGGEATFGPMIGAVMRCVADNVEDVIIPDCGHWITEEQPAATTKLVVDFLHRRFPYVGPPHQSRVTQAPHKTTTTQNQT